MHLAAYICVWIVAALASLGGLTAVWVPCVVIGAVLTVRYELLALLGSLVRIRSVQTLDSSHAPAAASARTP